MNSDIVVAVHALVYLHHKQDVQSSVQIAENVCTNPVRVRHVMSVLCKAGLVNSKRGKQNSGYWYEPSKKITLDQVADAFVGELLEPGWTSGDAAADCPICSGMAGYTNRLYHHMTELCMDYLKTVTIEQVERELFCAKEPLEK
ncbi:MAG: Rrf2 family transcriptional regulator [Eubacteriales bacterium]|nr:Rrf2 family transcriptional regulator [Eubacteriales bacterium]